MIRGAARAMFLVVLALSTRALAADGSLTGVVVDAATQSPIADASVTARGPALVGEQTVTTDETGAFEMTFLPSGTYGLLVKREGYQTFAPEGLQLHGRRVRIRLALMPVPREAPPPPPPAAPQASALNPVEFNEASMTPPSMLSGPSPEYTQEAIDNGVQGLMQVRCIVTVAGSVRNCKVLKGLPFMNSAVLEALTRRRYTPAMAQGKPVDVYYTFNIRLKLPQ